MFHTFSLTIFIIVIHFVKEKLKDTLLNLPSSIFSNITKTRVIYICSLDWSMWLSNTLTDVSCKGGRLCPQKKFHPRRGYWPKLFGIHIQKFPHPTFGGIFAPFWINGAFWFGPVLCSDFSQGYKISKGCPTIMFGGSFCSPKKVLWMTLAQGP